ncbi:MAG TPA: hypothetical protein PLE61_10760 [Vicinamibacterales bacterium]|nr:hypothetical protein [Vicinamibacterales bacterium]HPW21278.1 hypothetical protein [Vicinamibacterales bacterium]
MARAPVSRVIAVGASNLVRGFHAVVAAARSQWGPGVEILAALGHGRSYGAPSTVVCRTLPAILDSGLWQGLDALPPAPARALVTDVGNDILYGSPPARVLGWAGECVSRLARHTRDITITGLPPPATSGLSRARFLVFRSLFFPGRRLDFEATVDAAREVDAGLEALAAERGIRFCRLDPAWYGVDPIHIRPKMWRQAWQEILCGEPLAGLCRDRSVGEAIRLYCRQPERVRVLGVERHTPQTGRPLRRGGRIWLF